MEKIHKLILGFAPNEVCNLKCEYCFISRTEAWDEKKKMKYSPEHMASCLSKERVGGTSLINLTGNGETLLVPEITVLAKLLLEEGHFVEIVTNGTITKQINDLLTVPKNEISHLFFKISFHYKELLRLGLMDQFFSNIRNIHDSGASFTLELMPYDEIEKDIPQIVEVCEQNVGAICQATVGRDDRYRGRLLSKHSVEEYRYIWKPLQSPMMEFKLNMLNVKRREFCYAGEWSFFVNLYTGETQPCYRQPFNQNIFENPNKPIRFAPVGHHCAMPYCINAHAHLTWGLIPELELPSYDVMRNRVMDNNEEWITKEAKSFFMTKLKESNKEYTYLRKLLYTIEYPIRMQLWFLNNRKKNWARIKKQIKRRIKWGFNGSE